ncbi:hypothetical protein OQA88_10729 [Cercophora sp. LCS_1]
MDQDAASSSRTAMFQCGLCQNHYRRLDHLSRHVRSHTQSKPYQCHICAKSFGRTDLLKRHLAAHGVESRPNTERPLRVLRGAPDRVTHACRACATNHLRCTEKKPCRRCVERNIDCVWKAPSTHPTHETPSDSNPSADRIRASDAARAVAQDVSQDAMARQVHSATLVAETLTEQDFVSQQTGQLNDNFFSGPVDLSFVPGQWSSLTAPELDFASALALNDVDLQFLNEYNVNVPFEWESCFQDTSDLAQYSEPLAAPGPEAAGRRASLCTEAFSQAYWKFCPGVGDHGGAEEHHLSLPSDGGQSNASLRSGVGAERRATAARLSPTSRDKIVAMVVKGCRQDNLSRAVESFPSVHLLDTLIQHYLTSPVAQARSFLHAPTFDPNTKRPELLAAMAAAGAILTADPTLTKLGLAIQECVRIALPIMWEQDNRFIRDLELSQAFLLTLEIGLWSAHGRKVEIAETLVHCLTTMLRRGGRLRHTGYPDIDLVSGGAGELDRAWSTWVEGESFKRLVFRLLCHDTNTSMALLINPLISYAELSLPLPDSSDLWAASTAEDWSVRYSSRSNYQRVTVADYIDDPEEFLSHSQTVDVRVARSAFLSAAWSLCWEYVQLGSLQRSSPRRWNALLSASRLEELLRLLNHFRICMEPHLSSADVATRLEHTLLHLHTPFESVHVFAGMEGPEQARTIHPLVSEWATTEAARKAVWHGAQIVRAAKSTARGTLQGASVVMLYQAGLTLWAYGILTGDLVPSERWDNTGGSQQDQGVWLEDQEGVLLQRFIQLGAGSPFIRGIATSQAGLAETHLSEPDKIMEAVINILRHNHEGLPKPLLVDRLIQLMAAVQRSSRAEG